MLFFDSKYAAMLTVFCTLSTATLVVGCASPQVSDGGAKDDAPDDARVEAVATAEVWPTACESALTESGCRSALIEKYTRQVCEKNTVAMACMAGIGLQTRNANADTQQLEKYAARACGEGVEEGCLLEGYFMLGTRTAKAYYRAREQFRRHCSADKPANCLAAGDALLSIGASSEAARPFLDQACQNGLPAGCRLLGLAHKSEGKDGSNAFEKGCFAGDVPSCKILQDASAKNPDWAVMPRLGMSQNEFVETAWSDCKAAKQPDCVLWAEIALERFDPRKAQPLAETLFDVGCQAGAPDACFFYGYAVANGFDGEPKPRDAERWREKGCSMGWAPACAAPSVYVE